EVTAEFRESPSAPSALESDESPVVREIALLAPFASSLRQSGERPRACVGAVGSEVAVERVELAGALLGRVAGLARLARLRLGGSGLLRSLRLLALLVRDDGGCGRERVDRYAGDRLDLCRGRLGRHRLGSGRGSGEG